MEDATSFEKLRDLVENIYTNEYLNKITSNWSTEFGATNGDTGSYFREISSLSM